MCGSHKAQPNVLEGPTSKPTPLLRLTPPPPPVLLAHLLGPPAPIVFIIHRVLLQVPDLSFGSGVSLGLHIGMCVPLLFAAMTLLFLDAAKVVRRSHHKIPAGPSTEDLMYSAVPVFRGTAVLILAIFLWGMVSKLIERKKCNYVVILDLDPRTKMHWKQTLSFGAFWAAAWLWTWCIFTAHVKHHVVIIPEHVLPPVLIPCVFLVFFFFMALCPFDILHRCGPSRPSRRQQSSIHGEGGG